MEAITEHRIDLTSAARYDRRGRPIDHGKAHMTYRGESLGEPSNQPLFNAARRLLNRGLARPEDRIVTYRGDTPSMQGTVGWAAELVVIETDGRQATKGKRYVAPQFGFARFRPFDQSKVSRTAAP